MHDQKDFIQLTNDFVTDSASAFAESVDLDDDEDEDAEHVGEERRFFESDFSTSESVSSVFFRFFDSTVTYFNIL